MSVERARSGNGWNTRWREGGRSRSRLFILKEDAKAFDREVMRRKQLGPIAVQQLTRRDGPTLDHWVEQRWVPEHCSTLMQATRDRYASSYALHVQPCLGSVPLGHLTVASLREWQAGRLAAGASPETIIKARVMLSSVLRHAAESEAISANPLSVVRAPKPAHRDAVTPLSPIAVERIRVVLAAPMPIAVLEGQRQGRRRAAYVTPDQRSQQVRARDALVVSVLAYSGLRPGELQGLRWDDIREHTITVQRATNPDGSFKATKNTQRRSVRLMAPLAQDFREYRLLAGRPPDDALVFPRRDGCALTHSDWGNWRARTWHEACVRAGFDVPRPYDLRHSAASLWLAEGQQPLQVARWLGHSPAVLLKTYAHLIAEYAGCAHIDAEREVFAARERQRRSLPQRAASRA
jgi:integrase